MSGWVRSESPREVARCCFDFTARREPIVLRSVSFHLRQCLSRCRRIVRLRDGVSERPDGVPRPQTPMGPDIIGMLDSHFRCLDEPVTCARVRPFLPDLLVPSVGLRIPTPITVHLDRCPQCARDLRTLRELGLRGEPLRRLHWLYGSEPACDPALCRQARPAVPAFVRGVPAGMDGALLSHLATCPACRADVYTHRQALLDSVEPSDGCRDNIEACDLLDHVIPCGDVPSGGRLSHVSHMATCRKCLETIQATHRAVYGVLERPESGITTIYSTVGDAEADAIAPDDPYAGYPVRVRTIRPIPQPAVAQVTTPPKRVAFNPHTRRLLKAALAAAAMVPLAVLFHYTHSASGVTLGAVVNAFEKADNIHMVQINPANGQIVYELWVSRGSNTVTMAPRGKPLTYNLSERTCEDTDTGEIVAISDGEYAYVKRTMELALGFRLADIQASAEWNWVRNDEGYDVYALTWADKTWGGRPIELKYEITIDGSTKRPKRVELSYKGPMETDWSRRSTMVLDYPIDAE